MKNLIKQGMKKVFSLMLLMMLVLQNYSPAFAEDTDAYGSSLNFAGAQTSFYGGELVTIYNNVSVSGNQTELEEGSYTVISLPKASFQRPKESDVSTNFDMFKSLEIRETDDAYEIVTTYKTIYGGYVGGTPFRVNLLPRQTVNLSEHPVTQKFYNSAGEMLTQPYDLNVGGRARIESFYNSNYSAVRMINEVDENYVIKDGTEKSFSVSFSYPNSNTNDPRDRRIYIDIPSETTIKEGTGWTLDDVIGKYYKDIKRDQVSSSQTSVILDLSGIDMSAYNATNKYKTFRVNYSIQPVVDGEVQTDLGPYTGYCSRSYYILEKDPPPPTTPGAYTYWYTRKYNKIIDQNYASTGNTALNNSNVTYISYNPDELDSQRIRYSHQNVTYWTLYYAKNDADTREMIIESSQVHVSSYTQPSELRIMLMGLSGDDLTLMQEKLQGTKAYGVAADGKKTLLMENVPVVSYSSTNNSTAYSSSFDDQGWQDFTGGENYRSIYFEYPNGGISLKGQTEISKFYSRIWTEVIADIKPSTYETLKGLLESNKTPYVYSLDYAYTWITSKYLRNADDENQTVSRTSSSHYTYDYFRMQYETITASNYVNVTNGSQFFAGDTITTRLGYDHNRYGNFSEASNPENINIYYLVPDGLEPVEDPINFKNIEVVRGYSPGYNLVIAEPQKYVIPSLNGTINRTVQNRYDLSFTATERLQVGTYRVYSCLSIDNNKIGVRDGQQYGILQFDTPSGLWGNITKDADNRPDDNTKFTNLSSASFTIYPPKVLSSIKYVKLSSEPDSRYASSLGRKATIGDAIDYRWLFKNNSPKKIDSMIVLDILPYDGDVSIVPAQNGDYLSRGSKFKTPLISVDAHTKFNFYYTTDEVKPTTQENANASWMTEDEVEDMSEVTMIKAVLKDGEEIAIGEEVHIHTHNIIENDSTIRDGEKAYNSFAISLNNGGTFVEALKVEVQVTYPKRDVRLEKSDLNDPDLMLYNAVFSVYEVAGAEDGSDLLVLDDVKTNYDGIATLPDLLVGKQYYLIEKQAPEGYATLEDKIYFTIEAETEENQGAQILKVTNDIPRVEISGIKVWDDGDDIDGVRPESITVQLYKMSGEKEVLVEETTVTPDEEGNWEWSFTNLPEFDGEETIVYTIKEVGIGKGYETTISGDAEAGYTITNMRVPETLIEAPPTDDENPNEDTDIPESDKNNPRTGDSSDPYMWLTLMLLSVGGLSFIVRRRLQRKE